MTIVVFVVFVDIVFIVIVFIVVVFVVIVVVFVVVVVVFLVFVYVVAVFNVFVVFVVKQFPQPCVCARCQFWVQLAILPALPHYRQRQELRNSHHHLSSDSSSYQSPSNQLRVDKVAGPHI